MNNPISITAIASISPLGNTLTETWENYQNNNHFISKINFNNSPVLVSQIPKHAKHDIDLLKQSDPKYKSLDNSVLFAIYASRLAVKNAQWKQIIR